MVHIKKKTNFILNEVSKFMIIIDSSYRKGMHSSCLSWKTKTKKQSERKQWGPSHGTQEHLHPSTPGPRCFFTGSPGDEGWGVWVGTPLWGPGMPSVCHSLVPDLGSGILLMFSWPQGSVLASAIDRRIVERRYAKIINTRSLECKSSHNLKEGIDI